MAVGKSKIGSKGWTKQILYRLRMQMIPELIPIIGTVKDPKHPPWMRKKRHGGIRIRFPQSEETGPSSRKVTQGECFDPRTERALEAMEQRGTDRQYFLTVVTSMQLTHDAAIEAAYHDIRQLDSYIRRRIPNAIYVLSVEVDVCLAGDVADGLIPNHKWKQGLSPNQLVYKVHVHAPISAPDHTIWSLEDVFTKTATGKRSNLYSGSNQVRAIDMYVVSVDGVDTPDVRGCIGYARKNHYRAPVTSGMLEGCAEWLLIANAINTNPNMTRVGGVRKYSKGTKAVSRRAMSNNRISVYDEVKEWQPKSIDHLLSERDLAMLNQFRSRKSSWVNLIPTTTYEDSNIDSSMKIIGKDEL